MAIPSDTVWEVQSTGSDANGGGWSASSKGANGQDLTQSAPTTFTTLTNTGTTTLTCSGADAFTNTMQGNVVMVQTVPASGTATSGGTNTLTDSGKAFTANQFKSPGTNGVQWTCKITGGTGSGQELPIISNTATALTVAQNWTTQPDATSTYQVISYEPFCITGFTSSTSVTIDRAPTAFSGVTGKVGGPLATPGRAGAMTQAQAADNIKVWVQNGTYLFTSLSPNVSGGYVSLRNSTYQRWYGYNTSIGRNSNSSISTKPVFKAAIASSILVRVEQSGSSGTNCNRIVNIEFDGNSLSSTYGFYCEWDTKGHDVSWCRFKNLTEGIHPSSNFCRYRMNYFESCTTGINGDNNASGSIVTRCVFKNCTTALIVVGLQPSFCIAWGCGTGFNSTQNPSCITNCLAYACTGSGFKADNGIGKDVNFIDCVGWNCVINYEITGWGGLAYTILTNCAGGGSGTNISGSTYVLENINFKTLSIDPTVSGSTGNFSPSTALSTSFTFENIATTSYPDLGPAQHVDTFVGEVAVTF